MPDLAKVCSSMGRLCKTKASLDHIIECSGAECLTYNGVRQTPRQTDWTYEEEEGNTTPRSLVVIL